MAPELNAPYQAESETNSGKTSREQWKPDKDLSKMSSSERQDWLKGDDPAKSEKWSSSSLSGFEQPDAIDESKSDKGDGDVTTVENLREAKADEAKDDESSESAASEASPEIAHREKHQAAYHEIPNRLVREFAHEFEEVAAAASRVPISAGLFEYVKHSLADSQNPAKLFRHLSVNPQLVFTLEGMQPNQVVQTLKSLDKKLSVSQERRITKAPPPAREVGGRGSSAGDDENTAIRQGSFTAFRKAANAKALERSKSR